MSGDGKRSDERLREDVASATPREDEAADDGLVWLVRYGWEMQYRRFVSRLGGGSPGGAARGNPEEPVVFLASRRCRIPYRLRFAGTFQTYGGAARAFVDIGERLPPGHPDSAYGSAYLLRWEQFLDFYRKDQDIVEKDKDPKYQRFRKLENKGYEALVPPQRPGVVFDEGEHLPYGTVVLLGWSTHERRQARELMGAWGRARAPVGDRAPVVVITSSGRKGFSYGSYAEPSGSYLQLLADGLRQTWPTLTDREVLDYLTNALRSSEDSVTGMLREPAWLHLSGIVRRAGEPRKTVAIVGGGIAGLYCAHELAKRRGFDIEIFEATPRFGGRIETVRMGDFVAEYGPMRFEPALQPYFDKLVRELQVPRSFDPMDSDRAAALTASDRYNLRHDELRHTIDWVEGRPVGDAQPDPVRPLDLLRLGVIRMFRESLCYFLDREYPEEEKRDLREIDLCVDTTAGFPEGRWDKDSDGKWTEDGKGRWLAGKWDVADPWVPARQRDGAWDPGHYVDSRDGERWHPGVSASGGFQNGTWTVVDCAGAFTRQKYRLLRTQIQEWLDHFTDEEYDELRRMARHRHWGRHGSHRGSGSVPPGHYLHDEGLWNAMNEELSPMALRYIREEGTFYHLLAENPNAVEWGIFWLRMFQTAGEHLVGIEGGSYELVRKLQAELDGHDHVRLRPAQEVVSIGAASDPSLVRLVICDRGKQEEFATEADHCVLALPLAPLRRLEHALPDEVQQDLRAGSGSPC